MPSHMFRRFACFIVPLALTLMAPADDLHIKKTITVGGNTVSSTETSIKGARERTVSGNRITLRQCDLKRTITVNDQAQTYFVANDPADENEARAAALATGAPAETGGKIVITTTVTDTGERKQYRGFPARHLKTTVVQEPSSDACSKTTQKFEIDGWYTDLSKEQGACAVFSPPVQQNQGCNDKVFTRHSGSAKAGYPLEETITFHNPDGTTTRLGIQASDISKQPLGPELFEVPANYRQVGSLGELNGAPPIANTQIAPAGVPNGTSQPPMNSPTQWGPSQQVQGQQAAWQQAQLGLTPGAGVPPMGGMPGMGQQPQAASTAVSAPKTLGPKAPGKIRVGVAPPEAQVGQGSNTGADYSTPIRNSIILLMDGPAVEIAALDARIPLQLQAEAQQKQCDYVLFSSVAVKHPKGGFGSFMKMAGPMASMVPMAGMAGGMGGAVAAQAAGMAASAAAQAAQQQAMSQLAGFNGQIKQKDDVTVQYQLVPAGQTAPRLQSSLQAKAKSDGEDVLTPLIQQTAVAVLTEVTKK